MSSYWRLFAGLILLFVLVFGLAELLDLPLLTDPWLVLEGRGDAGLATAGVGLLIADVVLPVPSSLIMIGHGALFGLPVGAALSLAGSVGAAAVGFGLGRWGGRALQRFVPADERRRAEVLLARWGNPAVVATRPVPIVAESLAILAGTTSMRWSRFLLLAAGGSLPAALLYAAAGAAVAQLGSGVLVFGLVLLMAAGTWFMGRRAAVRGGASPGV